MEIIPQQFKLYRLGNLAIKHLNDVFLACFFFLDPFKKALFRHNSYYHLKASGAT